MKKCLLLIICSFLFLLSCDKDESNRNFPRINTLKIDRITPSGVWIKGEIYESGNYDIDDYGFVYALSDSVAADVNFDFNAESRCFEKLSLGSGKGNIKFEAKLNRNLWTGKTYIAKAYAESNNKLVYGEEVEFTSQGGSTPEILSFSPNTAAYGDTIIIRGKNFSTKTIYNSVTFNNQQANVCYSSDTLVKVIVPKGPKVGVFPIKISVAENSSYSSNTFIIAPPQIDSLSVNQVLSGTKVKIYGRNFIGTSKIKVDNTDASSSLYQPSDSIISFLVPRYLPIGKLPITLDYLDQSITFPELIETILPTINSVHPKNVWLDSIITLRGTNLKSFKYLYLTSNYRPFYWTDSLARIKITEPPIYNKVHGYYDNKEIISEDSIQWILPKIESISKSIAKAHEEIIVEGTKFIYGLRIYFGEQSASVDYIDENTLKFNIPEVIAGTYYPNFKYSELIDFQSEFSITIPEIKITDVNPKIIKRGTTIDVQVENANLDAITYLYVDGHNCNIKERGGNRIIAEVSTRYSLSENPIVSIRNVGQTVEFSQSLQSIDPWKTLPTQDIDNRNSFTTTSSGIPIIVARESNGGTNSLYSYSENNTWTQLTSVQENLNGYLYSIHAYDDKIYFPYNDKNTGLQLKSYSLDNDLWESVSHIPSGGANNSFFSFIIEDKAYFGDQKSMSCLNLQTNTWDSLAAIPTSYYQILNPLTFVRGKKAYMVFYKYRYGNDEVSEFWEYDSQTNTWKSLSDIPFKIYETKTACNYNNKTYIVARGYNDSKTFWEYDSDNDNWTELTAPPGTGYRYISFIKNEKFYFGYMIPTSNYTYGLSLSYINLSDI